jgi:hypothetical protein
MKERDRLRNGGIFMSFLAIGGDLPGTQVQPLFIPFIVWCF